MKNYIISFALLFISILYFSCKKNTNQNNGGIIKNEATSFFTKKISATISGKVMDQNKLPIANAIVKIGSNTTTTNTDGLFSFVAITTSKKATSIQIEKIGFMPGYKTIGINAISNNYSETVLWLRPAPITFNTDKLFTHTTVDDCKITIPANSLVNKQTGEEYTGMAKAYVVPMLANENIYRTMPGGNIGKDENGNGVILKTYGMMDVELYDENNNALQIKKGKYADLSIALHTNVINKAPVSVPTWFIDEKTGIWAQEGVAILQNSHYNFSVKHFTPWNVDSSFFISYGDSAVTILLIDSFSHLSLTGFQLEFINSSSVSFFASAFAVQVGQFKYQDVVFFDSLAYGSYIVKISNPNGQLISTVTYNHIVGSPYNEIIIPFSNSPYAKISGSFSSCTGGNISYGRYYISGAFFPTIVDPKTNNFIYGPIFSNFFLKSNAGNSYTITVYDYDNLKKEIIVGIYDTVDINIGLIPVCSQPINYFTYKHYYPGGIISTDTFREENYTFFKTFPIANGFARYNTLSMFYNGLPYFNFDFFIDGNAAIGSRNMYLFKYSIDDQGHDGSFSYISDTSNLAVQVMQNDYTTGGAIDFTYKGIPSNLIFSGAFGAIKNMPDSVEGHFYMHQ
jgi:hypothetical protein